MARHLVTAGRAASSVMRMLMVVLCSARAEGVVVSAPAALSVEAIGRHAASLRDRGFTVLPAPIIDTALIARLSATTTARLDSLLDRVEAKGCDPLEQQYLFREICARQSMRWDLHVDVVRRGASGRRKRRTPAEEAYAELSRALLSSAVEPIVEALQGAAYEGVRPTACGAIVSRRGAAGQRPHADANLPHYAEAERNPAHRLFNCFVPLVDIAAGGGDEQSDGTQFWPASHLTADAAHRAWERALGPEALLEAEETLEEEEEQEEQKQEEQEEQEQVKQQQRQLRQLRQLEERAGGAPALETEAETPACCAGGVIIFDFRIIHGGLPSLGRERAVAYVICSTGGARDETNFPPERIADLTEADADALPWWDEIDFVQ